jgi:hypothetical protein
MAGNRLAREMAGEDEKIKKVLKGLFEDQCGDWWKGGTYREEYEEEGGD